MAPPRNQDLLQNYVAQLTRSKRWRSNDYDGTWSRMRDLYKGKHYEAGGSGDQLVINMSFATINVIAPSVAVSNPRFTVSARTPKHEAQAMFTEEVVNYIWRTQKYQQQFRLTVNDWLVFGHGWMKVGYKFVQEPKVASADPPSTEVADEGIDDREEHDGNVESEMQVRDDRPFAERISVEDIFVDPDCHTVEDMAWICQRIRRPVNDVRVDKRYTNTKVRKEVQPTTSSRFDDDSRSQHEVASSGAKDKGYVDIIEFYDLRRKTYCVFADGSTEGFLRNPEKMPYAFGHPFLMLRNYEVADEFYPIGELEQIEPAQLELNETRTQMINHRKRNGRKYLYMEDAFDDTGINALESDEDNTMVPVNAGQDLNRVIIPMPSIGVPPDFYNQSQMIEDDMDKVSGVSDYMRGQQPSIRRTATEAAMIQDAANSRAQDKMARIENFLALVGERLIMLLQQYMTGEQVVRVVGPAALPVWITYDKDYIAGQFDFDVEAGSTQPQNETFRRQSAMQLVDAMAPFAAAGVINEAELAKYVLQTGFGVKDPDQFIQAGPPPGAEMAPGEGAPPEQGPGEPPSPGMEQAPPMPGGPPGPAPAGPSLPGGPVGAPPPGGGPGAMGLPPELLQGLQMLMQQLPPQAQQQLVQTLQTMPPERRVDFVAQVVQEFMQRQQQQAGPPPGPAGAPPPSNVTSVGAPGVAPPNIPPGM
jgi:hypothetical protein